jgi:hypothetical protein
MQLTKNNIKTDEWEQRANRVLSHFGYKYPDEIDMYDICWRYGIVIKPLDQDYMDSNLIYDSIKHLKAFAVPKPKARRGTIYLKPGLNAVEKKLLLAEEFCHIYSHFSSQLEVDSQYINKQEKQALRMSAYLLMPAKFLKQIYKTAVYEPVLISDIADHFLVTEEFAQFRLKLTFQHRVDGFVLLKNRLSSLEWIG